MALFLLTMLGTLWVVAVLCVGLERLVRTRPDLTEAALCMLPALVVGFAVGKGVGPLGWFQAPSVLLLPVVNWIVLILYLAMVPLRSGLLLARAGSVLRQVSESAIEVGPGFIAWMDKNSFGLSLNEALAKMRVSARPRFATASLPGPVTFGVLRPAILLPVSWLPMSVLTDRGKDLKLDLGNQDDSRSSDEVLVAVLHEIAHQGQGDLARGMLRALTALLVPFEWVQVDDTNRRLESMSRGWAERWLHHLFRVTGAPLRGIVESAWGFQEARADALALERANNLLATSALRRLRGETALALPTVHRGRRWWSAVPSVAVVVGLGLACANFSPGRPLLLYSLGGDGRIKGVQPAIWRLALVGNRYGQKPSFFYLPGTRTRKPQVAFEIERDRGKDEGSARKNQVAFLLGKAKVDPVLVGPKDFQVSWDFWVRGGVGLPPPTSRSRVLLFVRPTESFDASPSRMTQTYFGSEPTDYEVADLSGGHYRATWTSELPAGHQADLVYVEMRCYGEGSYLFNTPVIKQIQREEIH